MKYDHHQIKILYESARKKQDLHALQEYSRNYTIRAEFKFLGNFFDQKVEKGQFELLALPHFNTDLETFRGVVEKLAGPLFSKGLVKKFGTHLEKYGVTFLNNYFQMMTLRALLPLTLDQLMALNHSYALPINSREKYLSVEKILEYYTPQRIIKLLSTYEIDWCQDLVGYSDAQLERWLPQKPKSFREIHDVLSDSILKVKHENVPLNQSLSLLDGKSLDNYVIEVPMESKTLIQTSKELHHCVHTFKDAILAGRCQIINLLENGKRKYTVEIRNDGEYFIGQFKGCRNEASMEGPPGDILRQKLINLINSNLIS
jgi:hypothetical protein